MRKSKLLTGAINTLILQMNGFGIKLLVLMHQKPCFKAVAAEVGGQ